ncbi:Chloride conductance regulatory protein ICln, partial [Linum grandiflorum]
SPFGASTRKLLKTLEKTLKPKTSSSLIQLNQSSSSPITIRRSTRSSRTRVEGVEMVPGLRQFTERTPEGATGAPVLDTANGEELVHVQPGVAISVGNQAPVSPGTLYISSKKVVWLSDVDGEKGYAVDFLSISLHAVSRDPEAYPSPCIYAQIETGDDEDDSDGSDSDNHDTVDLSRVTEMRLIPSDPSQLDHLFQIFCQCAELNPEPMEGTGGNNWIFSADQIADEGADEEGPDWSFFQTPTSSIGHSNGDADLARNVLNLQINDQRFEDAEEMEREKEN